MDVLFPPRDYHESLVVMVEFNLILSSETFVKDTHPDRPGDIYYYYQYST